MKKFLETTFGALAGIGFLCAGVAIFVWDIGKFLQARESRDWPRVEGRVTLSSIDNRRRESLPRVEYVYTVAGTSYTSGRISFDLFDKPGGQGRIENIIARYSVGKQVTVYHDPNDPETAVLEPEVYSPFFMPLLFGALFFFGGCLTLRQTVRQVVNGQPVAAQSTTTKRCIMTTAAMSVLVYAILVLVSLDSAVRDTFVKAFGERPLGMPNLLFILALQTLLYLPIPWVFWHWMKLTFQALEDGERPGIGHFLTVGKTHPHLRMSQTICIAGLGYFFVILLAWIIYTSVKGI